MAELIKMPKMSDTMTEGVIAEWHKKVGDKVSSGDILAEVETDKATMELESYDDGVLLHIGAEKGQGVPIDAMIAIIGEEGEDISELLSGNDSSKSEDKEEKAEASDDKDSEEESESSEEESTSSEEVDLSDIKAEAIRMPKMTDTMTEATFVGWEKKVGDKVSSGDILAEVETDKATMELESYSDGTLLYIGVEAGSAIPINGIVAIVGEEGANYQAILDAEKSKGDSKPAPKKEDKKEETKKEDGKPAASATPSPKAASAANGKSNGSSDGRTKASPLAKKLAEDKGISLDQVTGSGPNGRIIKADIEGFTPSAAVAGGAAVGVESSEEIPMNSMRKAIAKNLTASQFGAPHFYLTMDIDMEKAMAARQSMNEVAPVKISFNDMVVKAVAAALKQHPMVNSTVNNEAVTTHSHIHVGVAVAIKDGLVVPVIKHTDALSLSQISTAVKDLAGRAKDKKLGMDEMQGATFTISNLGMFGIESFTSIINAPASCIMAIGGIKEVPVVKNGQIVPGNIMKVTLTCDHRSVDGAIGAAFLQTFKGLLEDPVRILI